MIAPPRLVVRASLATGTIEMNGAVSDGQVLGWISRTLVGALAIRHTPTLPARTARQLPSPDHDTPANVVTRSQLPALGNGQSSLGT